MALDAYTVAEALLACAYAGVDHTGSLAINRVCMVPGAETAWDNCTCGQLTIAEERRYPSNAFPAESVDNEENCGEPYVVIALRLTLVRCVSIPDASGNPPTCTALAAEAQQQMKDKTDLRRAVMCCLTNMHDAEDIDSFQLGAQDSVGPAGACAGSDMLILVGLLQPCDC